MTATTTQVDLHDYHVVVSRPGTKDVTFANVSARNRRAAAYVALAVHMRRHRGQWVKTGMVYDGIDNEHTDGQVHAEDQRTVDELSAALRAAVKAGAIERRHVHRGGYSGNVRYDDTDYRWVAA